MVIERPSEILMTSDGVTSTISLMVSPSCAASIAAFRPAASESSVSAAKATVQRDSTMTSASMVANNFFIVSTPISLDFRRDHRFKLVKTQMQRYLCHPVGWFHYNKDFLFDKGFLNNSGMENEK